MTLETPISDVTSIGKKVAPKLKKLGLVVVQDLLFYWPFRYEDWSKVKSIGDVFSGDHVTIKGTLEIIQNKRSKWKKRLVTEAIISDDSGKIRAVWFHQPYLTRNLKPGDTLYLSGKVEVGEGGLQFIFPSYEKETKSKSGPTHTARIIPIYSLTKGVSQKQLRYLISETLKSWIKIEEWLPDCVIKRHNLIPLSKALFEMHFPSQDSLLQEAKHRFKFEELLLLQLRAKRIRQDVLTRVSNKIVFNESSIKGYVGDLPFQLTKSQKISAWEILQDLNKAHPMNRLLEGDVGSGKTVVASIAMLNSILSGFQVAYLVPTEILAQQQYLSLSKLLVSYNIKIALLTRTHQEQSNYTQSNKKQILDDLVVGNIDLIVGTHAIIQDSVSFLKLGLVVIDEQHRFGVSQRASILGGGVGQQIKPHLLSMTATPIPRSLALTIYGELDISIIDELPSDRLPIKTSIVSGDKRGDSYRFILGEIKKGRQVFVVCPLIDPSDKLGKKAVTEEYEKLSQDIFPNLSIELLHGKLKPEHKDKIMQDFSDGKIDILVSTPVIEVGIDVPNASVMLIESAERFGLAQLHQFRGRVGRGIHQSYCLLFSESTSIDSVNRLQVLVDSNNGFDLAKRDLEFRGPGEVYGIKQHGFDNILKVAKLTDYVVIKQVTQTTKDLFDISSNLSKFPVILEKLNKFEQSIHLE